MHQRLRIATSEFSWSDGRRSQSKCGCVGHASRRIVALHMSAKPPRSETIDHVLGVSEVQRERQPSSSQDQQQQAVQIELVGSAKPVSLGLLQHSGALLAHNHNQSPDEHRFPAPSPSHTIEHRILLRPEPLSTHQHHQQSCTMTCRCQRHSQPVKSTVHLSQLAINIVPMRTRWTLEARP
jgi:hypothetical protein